MLEEQTDSGEAARSRGRLHGSLDVLDWTAVKGWAFEPDNPEERVPVAVLANGRVIRRITADFPRADLQKSGIGDGAHAFVASLSRLLDPDISYEIRVVREADGLDLPRSPKLLVPAEAAADEPVPDDRRAHHFQEIFPAGRAYQGEGRAELLRDLARVHAAVGNIEEAVRLLRLAAADNPHAKYVSQLSAWLSPA